jgi:hypothetical protein
MGIPNSEVGYTSATTMRETTKSMKDMWWHWRKIKRILTNAVTQLCKEYTNS